MQEILNALKAYNRYTALEFYLLNSRLIKRGTVSELFRYSLCEMKKKRVYTNIMVTFLSFISSVSSSLYQTWLHFGHVVLVSLNLYHTLCKMAAIGVTPIPAPIKTACCTLNTSLVPVPYGPSM